MKLPILIFIVSQFILFAVVLTESRNADNFLAVASVLLVFSAWYLYDKEINNN